MTQDINAHDPHKTTGKIALSVTLRDVNNDREFEVIVYRNDLDDDAHVIGFYLKEVAEEAIAKLLFNEPDRDGSLKEVASAGEIVPSGIRKHGPLRPISVAGDIPYRDTRFERTYQAVDIECATLQAMFEMAREHFDDREMGFYSFGQIELYAKYMEDCFVEEVPHTAATFEQAFVDLVKAVRDGGDVDDAMVLAVEVLTQRELLEPPPARMAP